MLNSFFDFNSICLLIIHIKYKIWGHLSGGEASGIADKCIQFITFIVLCIEFHNFASHLPLNVI